MHRQYWFLISYKAWILSNEYNIVYKVDKINPHKQIVDMEHPEILSSILFKCDTLIQLILDICSVNWATWNKSSN